MTFLISDAILGLSLTKFLLHLLNFAILFVCLWLILYKPVMKFIRERQERIDKEKKEAAENLKASEEARQAAEERLRTLDQEIDEKRAEADRRIAESCDQKIRDAETRAGEIIADAEEKAQAQAGRVIESAKEDLKEVAVSLAENIIEKKIDEVDDALIDNALKDWKNG